LPFLRLIDKYVSPHRLFGIKRSNIAMKHNAAQLTVSYLFVLMSKWKIKPLLNARHGTNIL
jgi:hypothetical protein